MHNPWPVDLEAVAVERAKERRECAHYAKCLIRAAYESPGLIVPCAPCGGFPSDIDGLEALVRRFRACRNNFDTHGAQVHLEITPECGRECYPHMFAYEEMERARQWLRGRDTSKIFVDKYLNIY